MCGHALMRTCSLHSCAWALSDKHCSVSSQLSRQALAWLAAVSVIIHPSIIHPSHCSLPINFPIPDTYTSIMKFSQASLLAACLPAISARFVEIKEADHVVLHPEETFLIELAPGETAWVTEEEKWELRRVSINYPDLN